jgi:drug/metabolite transporter (DMT)-like permease
MTAREWSLLVALSVLWGGSFLFNGIAVRELPTFTVVLCRVALAAALLQLALRLGVPPRRWSAEIGRAFLVMGLVNNVVPFSLIVWGQAHIASGLAAILNATTPFFTVVVAHALTADEKVTTGRLLGVLIGLIGVSVMVGGDAVQALGTHIAAQIACLAAALSYAFAAVFGRRFTALGLPPMQTAAGQATASTLVLLPVVSIVDKPWTLPLPGAATFAALIGLAALSTALGYVLYFRILATAGATNVLLVTFLAPVTAVILGIMVLGETLARQHLVGMALIAGGLGAIDGRPLRLLTARLQR